MIFRSSPCRWSCDGGVVLWGCWRGSPAQGRLAPHDRTERTKAALDPDASCLLVQSEWSLLVTKSNHILEASCIKKKSPCLFHLCFVHWAQIPGICVCLGQNKGLYIHTLRLLNLSRILPIKHQFPRVLWRASAEYRRWKRSADSTGERTQSSSLAPSGAAFRANHLVSLSISALIRRTSGVNCVPLSRSAILMWNASLNPVLLVLCCNVNLFLQLDIFHLPVLC